MCLRPLINFTLVKSLLELSVLLNFLVLVSLLYTVSVS